VLSNDGQFQGVVATDVSLKELNDFVSNLKISPHGLAFIIEPDGALIASSAGPNIAVNQQRQAERLNASQDQASMVAITYAQLKRRLDPAAPARSGPVGFTFESPHGEPVRAAYEWIRDDAGLEWLTVVAMPERDYLSGVQGNAVLTLFVSLFAVSLTLLIGWLLVQRVVLDIRRLSEAAERIGRGLPPMVIDVERRDEVGHLARSFQLMQSELSVDRLTGLTSREALLRHLNSGIRRYQGSSQAPAFAVLFVDLNRFKSINDNYGHAVGDLALAEVAERLSSAVREGDVVARYGGDEFVMVLWRVGEHSVVQRISDKIHGELERPLACLEPIPAARGTAIGASIGVAFYPGDGVTADALIQFADRGMYAEKQAGREEGAI
jgi:diguanylate cyclase (GGDEF)-like protein